MKTPETLIEYLNGFLGNGFKFVIGDIPKEHIKGDNTKFVAVQKSDDDVYTDWYYNEFMLKLHDDAERMQIIDRDMDPILAGEFVYIGRQIITALNNLTK